MLSNIQLCVTLWTVAHQTPLSMGFSRQEYWSGLQCPPPVDLPNAGIKLTCLMSPALAGSFFTTGVCFYFFSRGSSEPRGWIHVFCIGRRILYPWVTSSVQFSCSVVSDSLRLHACSMPWLSCPSPTPRACWNSCPSSQWCHPAILEAKAIYIFAIHLKVTKIITQC